MRARLGKWVFVCALLLLLANSKFPPQTVKPKQPDIAYGGRAAAIAVDPNNENNIMVASDSGGLFRSTNHGANWAQVSGAATFWFTDVAYLPANDSVILATAFQDTRVVSGGGIWRSTDSGSTWNQVSLSPPTSDCADSFSGYGLAVETGRDRAWVGTPCGLAYSDDEGASWTFLPEVLGYTHEPVFAVLAPGSGRLFIRVHQGVEVSTDEGASWSRSNAGLPHATILSGAFNQLAVSPHDPEQVYWAFNYYDNGTHLGLYRSLDGAASWSPIVDTPGGNRPPFVKTADALSGDSAEYDIYFSSGGCSLQRATAVGDGAIIPSWNALSMDHCDPADIGFSNDGRTPILLASDGGLHATSDEGQTWKLAGAGKAGYNALQLYQVTGQLHQDGVSSDLYFGTQDNSIWASADEGSSWPANFSSEGHHLDVMRDFYPANVTAVTGQYCIPCNEFISGPVLAGVSGFPVAPNQDGPPRLLQPGYYVQAIQVQNVDGDTFALTTNTGSNWNSRFSFPEWAWDVPQVAGPLNDPVLYTEVREPGTNPDGSQKVGLKRTSDALGNLTPLVSDIGGFGSLGLSWTTYIAHGSFGVDPGDPNFLIVADTVDSQIKESTDAGGTWTPDTALTALVSGSGQFKFSIYPGFTQTTTFAFDPTCDGHILVGTRQAGIFETFDRGGSWQKVLNSELIPEVTSIYFSAGGRMIISSYGRGLWQYFYVCPAKSPKPGQLLPFAEPLIYWKGARIPISQIHDPEACPACGYFLLTGGRVLDYRTAPGTGQLLEVMISRGQMTGYNWQGNQMPLPFQVTRGQVQGGLGGAESLRDLQAGRSQIKGLFLEGETLRGLIVADSDLSPDQLPKTVALGPRIHLAARGPYAIDQLGPILLTGAGFEAGAPLDVQLDGQAAQLASPPDFDPQGRFRLSVEPLVGMGWHTISVSQDTPRGALQDITTFVVMPHDSDEPAAPGP